MPHTAYPSPMISSITSLTHLSPSKILFNTYTDTPYMRTGTTKTAV